jgi:hypothetical protein
MSHENSSTSSDREQADAPSGRSYAPLYGCLSGGCLVPLLLFFLCAFISGDTGGPLFWPICMLFFGVVGLVVGIVVGGELRQQKREAAMKAKSESDLPGSHPEG